MKKKQTYSEKLLDPRWQKKRLEVLEAANWTCANCGSKSETLHVHHLWYEPKKDPWDYPNEAYLCVCKSCHSYRQQGEMIFDITVRSILTVEQLKVVRDFFLTSIIIGQVPQAVRLLETLSKAPDIWDHLTYLTAYIGDLIAEIDSRNANHASGEKQKQ